jgi:hypothetical protein
MENKIDQFFKDKLESHTLSPSEQAWTRVEASLSKKNNIAVWRIAAAILITGALISIMIWTQLGTEKNQTIAAKTKSQKNNPSAEKSKPQISSVEKKGEIKSSSSKSSVPHVLPQSPLSQTEDKADQKKRQESEEKILSIKESITVVEKIKTEEKINQEATSPTTIASTKQKPIKLEFTLEEISSEQPVATASEEKSSGLKKVWELAREVKNGEGPVHEMKNELFAFNFRKNKTQ